MGMNIKREMTYIIKCNLCGATAKATTKTKDYRPDDVPTKYFYRKKWRNYGTKTYCPNCARHYKFQQKALKKEK